MYTARQIDAGPSPAGRLAGPRAGPRRVAHILAAVVALTMATASAAGLLSSTAFTTKTRGRWQHCAAVTS